MIVLDNSSVLKFLEDLVLEEKRVLMMVERGIVVGRIGGVILRVMLDYSPLPYEMLKIVVSVLHTFYNARNRRLNSQSRLSKEGSRRIYSLIEWKSTELSFLKVFTDKMLDQQDNSYAFTKVE